MTHSRREELISAYLDDELAPDEKAEVEKWLAESAEARQLLEDFRALSGRLHALPRHKLDHDLAANVVRQTERSVLAGHTVRAASAITIDSTPRVVLAPPAEKSLWSRGAGWRRLAWPAVAAAAALAMLLYNGRDDNNSQEVAQAPVPKLPPSSLSAPPEDDRGSSDSSHFAQGQVAGKPAESRQQRSEVNAPVDDFTRPLPTADQSSLSEKMGLRKSAQATAKESLNRNSMGPAADIMFEVTAEFLEQRGFEQLLDEKKIAWQRIEPREELGPAQSTNVLQRQLQNDLGPGAFYVVQADDQQVAEIVSALSKSRGAINVVRDQAARADRNRYLGAKDKTPSGVTFGLQVAPRSVPGAASKAAAPAPAGSEPPGAPAAAPQP